MIGDVDSRTNFCNSFGLFLTKKSWTYYGQIIKPVSQAVVLQNSSSFPIYWLHMDVET